MDAFRQWAMCIIIAAAAGTLICALSPRGSTDKTVRTVVGIFVVVSICTPLSRLVNTEFTEFAIAQVYDESNAEEELRDQMLTAFKNKVCSEIYDLGYEYGVSIASVTVDAYTDENECIIIQKVLVDIGSYNDISVSDFLSDAEDRIGVPVNVSTE